MPTNGDATGQMPPISSPGDNDQMSDASQVSSNTSDTPARRTGETISTLEEALDALEKSRKDALKYRVDGKELAELRAFRQQQEDAKLSADEKRDKELASAQERAAAAEERAQRVAVRAEAKVVATSLGIKPELALKLLDYAAIEFNEEGDPTNVAELLANVVEELLPQLASGQQQPPQQQTPQQPVAPQMRATNPSRDGRAGQIVKKDASQMARFGATPGLFKNQ